MADNVGGVIAKLLAERDIDNHSSVDAIKWWQVVVAVADGFYFPFLILLT